MFSYISGKLAHKDENYVVIDVNGVGFKIFTSQSSVNSLPQKSDCDVKFFTYMYIKEGIMDLYGFASKEELNMFEMLISVTGVGAKAAIAILSVMTASKLAVCIVCGDAKSITKAQGVGMKIAQRVVLELKDKIKNESLIPDSEGDVSLDIFESTDERSEAVNALMVLGYSNYEAKKAVSKVDSSITDAEEIIKAALKNF